jgi:heterodisulfide reductase subunit A
LDIKARLEKLADVALVSIGHNLCSPQAQQAMQKDIIDNGINRVVIAACSPELYGDAFADLVERVGLNRHLLSVANIREQCSWVHPDKQKATPKAQAQIEMAVNKARLLEAVEQIEVEVSRRVLVIGGGISGIEAAIELANLGLPTTLIEKEASLGGRLNQFATLYPLQVTPEEMLTSKLKQLTESENIDVLTSAELKDLSGEVGDFTAKIKKGSEEITRNFGAIILATGYETLFLSQAYGFELGNNIVTQSQLEGMLKKSPGEIKKIPRNVGFIFDICDEHSRISTLSALRDALAIKEKFGSEVYVLCRNLKVDGTGLEKLYQDVRNKGVILFKFESPPKISQKNGRINIQVEDLLLAREQVTLSCDLLVVEEKVVPRQDFATLKSMLNIGLGPGDFYQEDNVHLYPTSSTVKGIFFAGNCHQDLDLGRALTDASNAAFDAYRLISSGKMTVEVEKVVVDPDKCALCLTCLRFCPHNAIWIDYEKKSAKIRDEACQGCGVCAAVCPAKAIKFKEWSDDQILAELEVV